MISLECDYNNGAHPKVLQRLIETNNEHTGCYGFDIYCEEAKRKIMAACDDYDADIFFMSGGTQTNATVIDSILHSYEGVISVDSGHINTHECGSIEFTEHKIINVPNHNGKLRADVLENFMESFLADGQNMHSVFPGLVYITFPTEFGTIYTAKELEELYNLCKYYKMPLYIDGARLGYGLTATGNDIDLPFLAKHCDVFYIGGTKIGALCGEAVVFTYNNAYEHFFSIQKQHGAVLAKGRLLGLQFDALFTDNLYFDLARNANDRAEEMKEIFRKAGYGFHMDSPTNQQFVIIENKEVERLEKHVAFTRIATADTNHTICRFVTSWATTKEEIAELEKVVCNK